MRWRRCILGIFYKKNWCKRPFEEKGRCLKSCEDDLFVSSVDM